MHAGVLPDRLANGNIPIEARSTISCFLCHAGGRVTCPTGKELFKLRGTKYGTAYSSREAWGTFRNRCTDSKAAKHVSIGRNSTYVPV